VENWNWWKIGKGGIETASSENCKCSRVEEEETNPSSFSLNFDKLKLTFTAFDLIHMFVENVGPVGYRLLAASHRNRIEALFQVVTGYAPSTLYCASGALYEFQNVEGKLRNRHYRVYANVP